MALSNTVNQIRVDSSAKNGTLGTQGALAANQILFDTAITTNNSNLESSPSFIRRHCILRQGTGTEETSQILTVDVDGVTCTMVDDWATAPASGDAYHIAYKLDDVATIAGCDFETDSRQWVMTKRLIVGTAVNAGYFGMNVGEILRLDDRGPSETAFRVNAAGRFDIGTIKDDKVTLGAVMIFTNDADDEVVAEFVASSTARLYDFVMMSARRPTGVGGLQVTVNALADMEWARSRLYGMNAPFKHTVDRFKDVQSAFYATVGDIKGSPMWDGHLKSEADKSLFDLLTSETDNDKRVRILVEDA